MDLIELQAMMIRSQQVQKLMSRGDVSGLDALAFVVCPSDAVREASIEVAKTEGISNETRKLFRKPKPEKSRVVTIEELACS